MRVRVTHLTHSRFYKEYFLHDIRINSSGVRVDVMLPAFSKHAERLLDFSLKLKRKCRMLLLQWTISSSILKSLSIIRRERSHCPFLEWTVSCDSQNYSLAIRIRWSCEFDAVTYHDRVRQYRLFWQYIYHPGTVTIRH